MLPLVARRNEAAAGCFVNCKSAVLAASADGHDPMEAGPGAPPSDETIRETLPRCRLRPANRDNLAGPVRDRRPDRLLAQVHCARRFVCGKLHAAAELRSPGVTKRMAERSGPALARARHIC